MTLFPEDLRVEPRVVDDIVVDDYGNLDVFGPMTTLEGCARQFCNRWGWKKDRVAMLIDVRRLLAFAVTGETDDGDDRDRGVVAGDGAADHGHDSPATSGVDRDAVVADTPDGVVGDLAPKLPLDTSA